MGALSQIQIQVLQILCAALFGAGVWTAVYCLLFGQIERAEWEADQIIETHERIEQKK